MHVVKRLQVRERLATFGKAGEGTSSAANTYRMFGFQFLETGLEPAGTPTLEQYVQAGHYVLFAEQGSPFWLGDWLLYAERRPEWKDRIEQLDYGARSLETVEQYKRVARDVPASRRRAGLSFNHHRMVSSLQPEDQEELLDSAVQGKWKAHEMRAAVKRVKQATVLKGQADTMHEIEVTVMLPIEAGSAHAAEQEAWTKIQAAIAGLRSAKVVAAHARAR